MLLHRSLFARLRHLSQGWRQAVRMTVAALLAHAATQLFDLHQGQWAVITCLVVVQGSFANTFDATLSRVYGTLAGALTGALGLLALGRTGLPGTLILGAVVAPMAALAAGDARFRLAPVTAGLVVLAVSAGDAGLGIAVDRVGEILLGGVIGVACTLLILREPAEDALDRHAAEALAALGEIARAHLLDGDIETLLMRLETAFAKVQAATAEVIREQRVRIGRGPPPRPFTMALRRLRTDVALIERAVAQEGGTVDRSAAADAVGQWFAAAAAALRAGTEVPTPPRLAVDPAAEATQGFAAVDFALTALRREQIAFRTRAAERICSRAAAGVDKR